MHVWQAMMKVGTEEVSLFEMYSAATEQNQRFPDGWQRSLVEQAKKRVQEFARQRRYSGQEEVTALVLENCTAKTLSRIAERIEGREDATFGSLDPVWLLDTLLGRVLTDVRRNSLSTRAVKAALPGLEQKLKDQEETWLRKGAKWCKWRWTFKSPTRDDTKTLPEGGVWLIQDSLEVSVRTKLLSAFVGPILIVLEGELEIAVKRTILHPQDEGDYRIEVIKEVGTLPLEVVTSF